MSPLRDLVKNNFWLKLISIALATGLWLAVKHDPTSEIAVEVPVEFHNIPENLEISSENIPRAQVRMRGPERIVHRLQSSDVHVEVELSGVKPGERTFDLSARQVHLPRELEVEQIIPGQLRLVFDSRLNRLVEVRPRVIGNFAAGYAVEKILVDPPQITVSGPRKRVEAVEAAITDPVDVSGVMGRATFVTNAYVTDPMVQVINPAPVRVTVITGKVHADSGATGPHKPE